jgi:hypothetical protein
MAKPAIGFGARAHGEDTEAIKRMFTPEFRNRLDAIIGSPPGAGIDQPRRRQVRHAARSASSPTAR